MTTKPIITISIVSHKDAKKVDRLLSSLQKHEYDTRRFQLILTDNWKDDLPEFDSSPWASLHILRNNRQKGFAQNHNEAFKFARGEFFAMLNPDLVFDQPVFERLLMSMHAHQADLIAPKIVDDNGIVQDSFRTFPTPFEIIRRRLPAYKFEMYQPDHEGMVYPDWIAGMFWLMHSDGFLQMGGFDERYHLYFEDVDFCARAHLKGMKILVDTHVQIQHKAKRSSRRNLYYLFLHIQSAVRFFTSSIYKQILRKQH